MRKVISALTALAFALVLATIAAAQGTGRINGEIKDKDGNPWTDITVEIKNADTGQTLTVKTDKSGKFVQLGLRSGIYTITILSPKDNVSYPTKFQVADAQENNFKLDFKQILAENAAAHPDATKAKEEEENKFKNMKVHFDAGVAAMTDSNDLAKQLKTAPAEQKAALQQKRTADCETALTEFSQAEQGVGPKEVGNHAMVLGNLGQAQECAGHFEDASKSFQNAVDLKPQGNYYIGLSTNLAKAAMAQNDPKVTAAKVADASASCEKAVGAGSRGGHELLEERWDRAEQQGSKSGDCAAAKGRASRSKGCSNLVSARRGSFREHGFQAGRREANTDHASGNPGGFSEVYRCSPRWTLFQAVQRIARFAKCAHGRPAYGRRKEEKGLNG